MGLCNVEIFRRKLVRCFPAELKPTEQARAGFDDKSLKNGKRICFEKNIFAKSISLLTEKNYQERKNLSLNLELKLTRIARESLSLF